MTPEQRDTVTRLFEALSRFDETAMPAFFTDDAVVISPEGVFHGAARARRLVTDLARQYTGFVAEPVRIIADAEAAAVEIAADVTDFGGGRHRMDGCAVLDFRGPAVARARMYWRPEDMQS